MVRIRPAGPAGTLLLAVLRLEPRQGLEGSRIAQAGELSRTPTPLTHWNQPLKDNIFGLAQPRTSNRSVELLTITLLFHYSTTR